MDKYGTVLSLSGSGALCYRQSWLIGAVFGGIQWSTPPITPHRGREIQPIMRGIGTVQLSFLKTVPELSTLWLHRPFLNLRPITEERQRLLKTEMEGAFDLEAKGGIICALLSWQAQP